MLGSQNIASESVVETTEQIQAQTNALLTTQATGGTLTADGTEQNLYYDNEPLGVFRPIALILDLDAMQDGDKGGDTVVIKVYHRLSDGGGLQLLCYETWTGADGGLANGEKLDTVELYPNRHGFRITFQQTAGTNRTYPWELYLGV